MIIRFDHLVLTVRSIAATAAFYERALGFRPETADGRTALHFAGHKINLHEVGHEFEPKAEKPVAGSGDFCLVADEPVERIKERLAGLGIDVFEGPVERTGARAPLRSIYLRDPDGNLVEVANEVGWSAG